jgi:uncharacterized membrane protein
MRPLFFVDHATMLKKLTIAATAAVTFNATAADLRGFVTEGPAGLLVFQTCEGAALSKTLLKLSDKTPDTALTAGVGEIRQVRQGGIERPLYVEFSGDIKGASAIAQRFHRTIGHIESCATLLKDIAADTRLVAVGDQPGWRFVVTPSGGRFERPQSKSVRFPVAAFSQPAGDDKTRIYDAWSAQDGGTVRVEVTEGLCKHEGAEAAYGAQVTLRYGSSTYEGCAARF